jgi:hypothetical protein
MTLKVKSITQVDPVPDSVTCEPAGREARFTVPNASLSAAMSKTIPAHDVPMRPVPVEETMKTPGSAPTVVHWPAASCLQDGTSVMPPPESRTVARPSALQTVFVSPTLGPLLRVCSVSVAATPVWPTVTAGGT